jgi:hypothetical protein
MSWFIDGAKETGAQIRKEVRAAIKNGTLPTGSKVSVRKRDGSMMTAVDVNLTTANPELYYRPEGSGTSGFTDEGRKVARILGSFVAPHLEKVDGKMSFLHVSLDGRGFHPSNV